MDRLTLELEHQKELYNQSQSEIQFLRSQNDKIISNLISEKTIEKVVVKSTVNCHFYPKFFPRFTKQLIISDDSYKLVHQIDAVMMMLSCQLVMMLTFILIHRRQ